MRLIIAGGREFNDYELLKEKVDYFLSNKKNESIEIVSGKARGADSLGEKYANENGYKVKEFPADWNTYNKRAGYIRNEEMAVYATHCICFWDGESKGTKHMIDLAKRERLSLRVIRY
jgi:CRISPR/Cas system-associated protein Csx1